MESLGWQIGETANALKRLFGRRAAELGVTSAQWRVMGQLIHHPGTRQAALAERLDIEPITLTRTVDRLEEAGLVERRPDPADRRVRQLHLTAAAEPLVEKLRAIAAELNSQVFAGLQPNELDACQRMLALIRENIAVSECVKKAKSA
ncbi:MarR family winged helix-turn-helix transcriptional regulator [Sphingomonas sp. GCM10030256]|uniref:MarR family winged helix-turn-helix transcriptional regulator n=1 Tax=Sphingomonas sp. GCM10030256 TaxID=3273427 RepID=UPI003607215F